MNLRIATSTICTFFAVMAMAQSEIPDSIKTQNLAEVVIEAQLQKTNAQKSTYIPTTKQKNASQSGEDLIDQMGIPQLKVTLGNSIETNSGKPVAVFIDFIRLLKMT